MRQISAQQVNYHCQNLYSNGNASILKNNIFQTLFTIYCRNYSREKPLGVTSYSVT